jgi:hypothetical protein
MFHRIKEKHKFKLFFHLILIPIIFYLSVTAIIYHYVMVGAVNPVPHIVKDEAPGEDFFTLVQGHITIAAGLIGAATSIIVTIVGAVRWLRKQVLNENIKIREETVSRVAENKKHIEAVEVNLCNKITADTSVIKVTLETQKEIIDDIKKIVEKTSAKMDTNLEGHIQNTYELKDHEKRITHLEKHHDNPEFVDHK